MAVYIFSLMTGWAPGELDYEQGYRARLLKNNSNSVKYVFAELPERKDVEFYKSIGIDTDSMLSVHYYFTDNHTLDLSVKAEDKLEELRERLNCTEVTRLENVVRLRRKGSIVAELLLDENDRNHIHAVYYYDNGKLIRAEAYTDGVSYVNYYVTAKSDGRLYAKLVRRTFYNKDGSVAYNQIFGEQGERYLFPDGELCTKEQFMAKFMISLHLSEKDIVFIDRGISQCDYVQSLFQFGNHARFIVFFHSEHFYEKGQHPSWLSLCWNWNYLYWVKYSNKIQTMVVSTEEQENVLVKKLLEYRCDVPDIKVIPVSGVENLRYPEQERKKCSMITVSRIEAEKRIDWIIKSVILAHEVNPDISIDIYGGVEGGNQSYEQYLQKLVSTSGAHSYVRFMGHADVSEIYKNYEVYITASTVETYGVSLMEAIGSGNAMIGLDVRYGNRLFICPGENGYLVDFEPGNIDDNEMVDRVIGDMAKKIVEIFADEQRLLQFRQKSYEMAEKFSSDVIAEKWNELLSTNSA